MKTLSAFLLALALVLSAAAVSEAQVTVRPDYLGGYRTFDLDTGHYGSLRTDYMGGYRYNDSAGNWGSVRPDFMGGYRINIYRTPQYGGYNDYNYNYGYRPYRW